MIDQLCKAYNLISIHAPPRGATADVRGGLSLMDISIHAPPRGATAASARTGDRFAHFNSRPSARGDRTPPKSLCIVGTYFNSRPSARGDGLAADMASFYNLISIHAPPRGATTQTRYTLANDEFQFTPLREGRHQPATSKSIVDVFQFTPLREGRRALLRCLCR